MRSLELDHVFICVTVGAPEAEHLIAFGLTEGSSNVHPGQGTANRRFFFNNLMLELLWVHDSQAVQSEQIRPTYLWERWSGGDRNACPLGISLRSRDASYAPSSIELPFSSWAYHPPYLPANLAISIATNAGNIAEPLLFYIPFGQRQDTYPPDKAQPLQHPIGFQDVTQVTLEIPRSNRLSAELEALSSAKLLQIQPASTYQLILDFDGMTEGQEYSFYPHLPLTFRW